MVVGLNLANVERIRNSYRNNISFQKKDDVESLLNTSAKVENPIDSQVKETTLDTPVADKKTKSSVNEKIANVWKWFSKLGTMTKAAINGVVYGAIAAGAVLSGSWLFNTLPKAFSKNSGVKFKEVFLHPLKNISKSGKVMAGIVSGVIFAAELIAGKLNANQNTAVIDHKLNVGHRDK